MRRHTEHHGVSAGGLDDRVPAVDIRRYLNERAGGECLTCLHGRVLGGGVVNNSVSHVNFLLLALLVVPAWV
ncbi:hypothetical protein CUTER_08550 [Corynebacterium uterequi]|uniref:Uncharacterized protein n=1 Tax=Corynebacterium uterequi TaxID=1072256 RepID=A0A0G3HKR9_9CORY|nr:hypothetical protein CUTER_08550 [Corynebacterium uterequi]